MATTSNVFITRISRLMADRFSLEEIDTACFELGINSQEIPGDILSKKIRSLIIYMDHRGRLPELLTYVQEVRPNQAWPLPADDDDAVPPFKGLQFFTENDEAIFFGREALASELVSHLNKYRFLAVIGASGSGKSSVVNAGLIPSLYRGESSYKGQKSDQWRVHIITPGDKPLTELATSLTRHEEALTAARTLLNDLRSDSQNLDLWLRREVDAQTRLLLLVDQFEELFTQCDDAEERRLFVENLIYAVQSGKTGRLSLVLTLRADFYGQAVYHEALVPLLEKRQRIVEAMKTDELRQAIVGPLENTSWDYQPGLVDVILQDLGAGEGRSPEPGALPLLSHALLETWRRREGHTLTLAGYQDAGGVRKAIAHTADDVYGQFTLAKQAIARNIFLRLTELGEGTEDTRRRTQLAELIPQTDQAEEVQTVLAQLAQARLVTTSKNNAEVAHEALIREWPKLRGWLDKNRENLRLLRDLTEEAIAWQEHDQDTSFLYRGVRLVQVEEWVEDDGASLSELERDFLKASLQERTKEIAEKKIAAQQKIEQANKLAAEAEARRQAEAERAEAAEQAASEQTLRLEEQRRNANRLRIGIAVLVFLLIVAGGAAIFAFDRQNKTVQAQTELNAKATSETVAIATSLAQAKTVAEGAISVASALEAENMARATAEAATDAEAIAIEEANKQAIVANAQYLIGEGQTMYTDDPLLGFSLVAEGIKLLEEENLVNEITNVNDKSVLILKAGQLFSWDNIENFYGERGKNISSVVFTKTEWFVLDYRDSIGELWSWKETEGVPLNGEVQRVWYDPNRTGFIVDYSGESAELWLWGETAGIPLNGSVQRVWYDPNGEGFIVDYSDEPAELWLWGETAGIPLNGSVQGVWFDPNGTGIVVDYLGESGLLLLREETESIPLNGEVLEVEYDPNGTGFIVTYSDEPDESHELWLWGETEGIPLNGEVQEVWYDPNGEGFIVDYFDGSGELWLRGETEGIPLNGEVSWVEYDPNGAGVIVDYSGESDELWLWGETEGIPLNGEVSWVEYDPNGAGFIVDYSGESDELWLWGETEGIPLNGEVLGVEYDPNGAGVIIVYFDGSGELWLRGETEGIPLNGEVSWVLYDPNGAGFIVDYSGESDELWLRGETEGIPLNGEVSWVAYDPNGTGFIVDYSGESAELWLWGEMKGIPLKSSVQEVWYDRNGVGFVVSLLGESAELWLWGEMEGIPLNGEVSSVEYDPNGAGVIVVYSGEPAELWLWGETEGIPLNGEVLGVEYDPNGAGITIRYTDGHLELWDFDNRLLLSNIGNGVNSIAFSADYTWFLVLYESGQMMLLDIGWLQFIAKNDFEENIGELIDHACGELLSEPLFVPLALDPYLDALPDGQPQVCPELYE